MSSHLPIKNKGKKKKKQEMFSNSPQTQTKD